MLARFLLLVGCVVPTAVVNAARGPGSALDGGGLAFDVADGRRRDAPQSILQQEATPVHRSGFARDRA